jgi:hypothetical protein
MQNLPDNRADWRFQPLARMVPSHGLVSGRLSSPKVGRLSGPGISVQAGLDVHGIGDRNSTGEEGQR